MYGPGNQSRSNHQLAIVKKNEVAIVPAAGNILSVLLFRQSTRFLTIKYTSCMLCPEYSTLGHTSSRFPRVFDFRGREK